MAWSLPASPRWLQLKCDCTRWRTGGEVKGKLANGVGSHFTLPRNMVYPPLLPTIKADAHNSAASSRLNWRPWRFKWTLPFIRKTKSGFCACAITFQLASVCAVIVTLKLHIRKITKQDVDQKVCHLSSLYCCVFPLYCQPEYIGPFLNIWRELFPKMLHYIPCMVTIRLRT